MIGLLFVCVIEGGERGGRESERERGRIRGEGGREGKEQVL